MTSRSVLQAAVLAILCTQVSCSRQPPAGTSGTTVLRGVEFRQTAESGRIGLVTGLLHCEVGAGTTDSPVFHVGFGRLTTALSVYIDQDTTRAISSLRELLLAMPVDGTWINREPGADDPSVPAPLDGDYWRLLVSTRRDEAVGFLRGFAECDRVHSADASHVQISNASLAVEKVSAWYRLDSESGELDATRAGVPLAYVIRNVLTKSK